MQCVLTGDWREVLPGLPAGEAALAIVDGPYNMRKAEWDKFASWEAFRAWYRPLWAELSRVLRDNCSLYVWGTFESLAALKPDLDAMGEGWGYRGRVVWHKCNAQPQKGWNGYRTWAPMTEDALFYARERVDISALAWDGVTREDNTIRAYLNAERERAGVSVREVAEAFQQVTGSRTVTGMASHWFGQSQWQLPTRENYLWLRDLFNARNGGGYLRREYEDLRYPFNPQAGLTDVWEVPICAGAERVKRNGQTAHLAQKPVELYRRMIAASSNPGDLVIDPMAGTGTTAVACKRLERRSVCVEIDESFAAIARARIAAAEEAPEETIEEAQPQLALAST